MQSKQKKIGRRKSPVKHYNHPRVLLKGKRNLPSTHRREEAATQKEVVNEKEKAFDRHRPPFLRIAIFIHTVLKKEGVPKAKGLIGASSLPLPIPADPG